MPADREEEQTRLNAYFAQLEVANSDLQEDYQELINGDEAFRQAQAPPCIRPSPRNTLEKDLSKAASDIKQVHGALNHKELDKLHAYNIDLQQKLQLVTNQLTRLSLPTTISLPITSTPNMSSR